MTSQGPLGLQRPAITRLDLLVGSGGPATVSTEGASPTTLSTLGGPSAEIPSSKDT